MPSDNEDEKEMEARFERETATAEEWVDVVVDVVGELEDLLDDGDGYDADDDADESKSGQSFRDAINALERRAIEGEDWDSDEHSLSQSALHGEFRKLVEDRLDSVLNCAESRFYGAFVLRCRVDLHTIDTISCTRRTG